MIEEDKRNRESRLIGECLEYFLKHKIFEYLCAYLQTDKPAGFFDFGLQIVTSILQGIQCTSFISHYSIHPPIVHLLGIIHTLLKDRTSITTSRGPILEFVRTITIKVYNEPYIVNLLFTGVKKQIVGERGRYLPLEIVLLLLRYKQPGDNIEYQEQLQDTL